MANTKNFSFEWIQIIKDQNASAFLYPKKNDYFPKFNKKENVRIHLPTNSTMMIISKIHDLRQYILTTILCAP
jgi:hypothetical protein